MAVSRRMSAVFGEECRVDAELSSQFYSFDQLSAALSQDNSIDGTVMQDRNLQYASHVGLQHDGPLSSTMVYPQHSTPLKRRRKYHQMLKSNVLHADSFCCHDSRKTKQEIAERSPRKLRARHMIKKVISSQVAMLFDNTNLGTPDTDRRHSSTLSCSINTTVSFDSSESFLFADTSSSSLTPLGPRPPCIGMEDKQLAVRPADTLIDSVLDYDDVNERVILGCSDSNAFISSKDSHASEFMLQAKQRKSVTSTISNAQKKDIKRKLKSFAKKFRGAQQHGLATLAML